MEKEKEINETILLALAGSAICSSSAKALSFSCDRSHRRQQQTIFQNLTDPECVFVCKHAYGQSDHTPVPDSSNTTSIIKLHPDKREKRGRHDGTKNNDSLIYHTYQYSNNNTSRGVG